MEKIELKVPLENIENILGTVTSPSIVLSELIKNAIDSNAEKIRVDIYTTPINRLVIEDFGDGLSYEDIKNLGNISVSNKKINDYFLRKDGSFLAGNKGLGILSLFSIVNEFTMETERGMKRYKVVWSKGQSSFTCEEMESKNINGTLIDITDIDSEYLTILTDENELNKLKHLSIKNYIKSNLSKKDIQFFIDRKECSDLYVTHMSKLSGRFKGRIKFSYDSKRNLLFFQYLSQNNIINNKKITLDLNKDIGMSDMLKEKYNITKVCFKGKSCKYLAFPLDDFEGEILATENQKDNEFYKFGEGVRVFVNQFAMYGYLDRQNDWLNLSVYSLQRKNTMFKPHNVFGYVHFNYFNENESNLKISNERAYFIENGAFKKFHEIMKNVITALAFNIDVAERNGWVNGYTKKVKDTKSKKDNQGEADYTDVEFNTSDFSSNNTKNNSSETQNNVDSEEKETDQGDGRIPSPSNQPATVVIEKKPKFRFFNSSSVLKNPYTIELEHHELIHQLSKLDYKNFYLLFVISFRAIIEDISKKYLNARGINLCGDFGQNVRLMADDILYVTKNPQIIDPKDKVYIENYFGGYNAFRNYFEVLGKEFYDNGKQGAKATNLNLLAHSPRWMEIEEAENISNNTILPLYFAYIEIINRKQK